MQKRSTNQRKVNPWWYARSLGLTLFLFLLSVNQLDAQRIVWSGSHPTTAENVNVGSSEATDIYFYFEVEDAGITNGRIIVTLPYAEEAFDLTKFPVQQMGGNITLPTPTASGQTLTFSGVNLPQGSAVYYRIPRVVKTEYNGIRTTGAVKVNVYSAASGTTQPTNGSKTDLNYSYNYAVLQFLDPSPLPTNQVAGLQMNFGDNNGVKTTSPTAQTYTFNISCTGGQVDSLTFKLKYQQYTLSLSNWKLNGTPLPSSQIFSIGSATPGGPPFYATDSIKIRNSDIPGGKGFKDGDILKITVDVMKNSCGVNDVIYSGFWATTANVKAAKTSTSSGSFNANPGDGKQPVVKALNPIRVTTGPWCHNGNVEMITIPITNTGFGEARNIRMNPSIGGWGIIDTTTITVRKGKYGTPSKVRKISQYSAITSPSYNSAVQGKFGAVIVDLDNVLLPGDTLYLDYGIRWYSDYLSNSPGVNFLSIGTFPYAQSGTGYYTDACATQTYAATSSATWLMGGSTGYWNISSFDGSVVLGSSETKEYTHQIACTVLNSTDFLGAGAKITGSIVLPKGIQISSASDIKVFKPTTTDQWPISNFQVNTTASPDSVIYTFDLVNSTRQGVNNIKTQTTFDVKINLTNTCSPAVNSSGTFKISYVLYPTGSTTGGSCADVAYTSIQVFPSLSRLCVPEYVHYDFEFQRMNLGLKDDNDDRIPDDGTKILSSTAAREILVNDTVHLNWKSEILEDGNKYLYAVVFFDLNQSYISMMDKGVPFSLTLNGNNGLLQTTPKNTLSGNVLAAYDRGTTVPSAERYAYIWEISKLDGSAFSTNDKVNLIIPMKATEIYTWGSTYAYANKREIKSWLYATVSSLANIPTILSPGTARRGPEEYPSSYYIYGPQIGAYSSATQTFVGTQSQGFLSLNGTAIIAGTEWFTSIFSAKEYRHISTLDSVVLEVPEGYILPNTFNYKLLTYTSTGTALYSAARQITAKASDADIPNRKTFVFGPNVFDVNRNDASKFPLPDGYWGIAPQNLSITSTNAASSGNLYITVYADNHTYTQANVPALGNAYSGTTPYPYARQNITPLQFVDPGSLKINSAGSTIRPALSSHVTFDINLQNTKTDGDAYSAWLYVQGPVSNAVLTIGGVDYKGADEAGEGGRWIKLPVVKMNNPLTGTLTVEYNIQDCNDQKITLYPLFDRTKTAQGTWTPTTAGITMTDAGFTAAMSDINKLQYIYAPLKLVIQNVPNRISGSITDLATTPVNPATPTSGTYGLSTIQVGTEFPVELVFNTNGGQGSVVKTKGTVVIPSGLKYVTGSAYIDFNGVNTAITGTMLTELAKADGTIGPKTLSLDLATTGVAALGNGELPGTTLTYLRFKLLPECDVNPIAQQITLQTTGERTCGGAATNSGAQTYNSSYLILTGTQPSFDATATLTTTKTLMSCKTGETEQTITFKFKKTNKPTVGVATTDSISVEMPAAINIKSTGVNFSFPALGSVAAQTGTLTPSANVVTNGIRRITWQLPVSYFTALAAESNAALADCSYTFDVEFIKSLATEQVPSGTILAAVLTSTKTGPSCPAVQGQAVAKTANIAIMATPLVDKPADVTVCNGIAVPQINLTGNYSVAGYGYSWAVTSSTTGASIGMSAESGTGTSIPAFTTTAAGTVTITVTPTYGDCTGTAKTFTITVNPLPDFTVTPASLCANGSVDLTSTVTNITSGATVKYFTANDGTGELTGSALTVNPTTTTTYYAQATSTSGCISAMKPIVVNVNPLPAFTLTSTSEATCSGTPFNLSSLVTSGSLTNGVLHYYSDAACTIELASSNVTSSGTYYLRAENATSGCMSTAQSVTITLNTPTTISSQPAASTTVCSGTSVTLNVSATGEGVLSYQWYNAGGALLGKTSSTYSPTISGTYYVIVTGDCGPVQSNNAVVTINPQPTPSFISGATTVAKGQSGVVYTTESGYSSYVWNVTGGTITSGGNGNSTATVTWGNVSPGTITVTYQSNGCSATAPASRTVSLVNPPIPVISGTTSVCPINTYTYTTESGMYNYNWTITGGTAQTPTTGSNSVTILWNGSVAPSVEVTYRPDSDPGVPTVTTSENITKQQVTTITTNPVGGTTCYGTGVAMNTAVSCTGTPTYAWKKDGVSVGGNTANYTATESGSYTVDVNAVCGSATSTPVTVTVKSQEIATLSGANSVVATQEEVYTAGAGSNYTWTVTDGTIISGGTVTDPSVTVRWGSTSTGEVSVSYEVFGCPTTEASLPVTITSQTTPTMISPETSICFNSTQNYSTQSGKYNYTWTVSGGTISVGQGTNAISVIWGTAGSGTIKVAYSSSSTSTPIESTVTNIAINSIPTVATITAPAGVCDNSALSLTSPSVTSAMAITAQSWKLNGTSFTSGSPVAYAQNGQSLYYEATNACGSAVSNTTDITVYALPSISATGQSICPGSNINLVSTVANPAGYTLLFYTVASGGTALTNTTVSPVVTTTYYVEANNANNCTNATRVPVTITMKDQTQITTQPVSPGIVVLGNPFSLTVAATGSNLTYEWFRDGSPILTNPTSSTATFTVTAATNADYGTYHVVVSGDCGLPQISDGVAVSGLGSNATLKDLKVNGVSIPDFNPAVTTYSYYVSCDLTNADVIGTPNDVNATVTNVTNFALNPGDNYIGIKVIAENGITTKTYNVNVVRSCFLPKILKDLNDAVICVGGSQTWTIDAEGEELTYEWYKGEKRIMGQNSNTLTISNAKFSDYDRYYAIVRSNHNGFRSSVQSKIVRLWVADYLPAQLRFAEYPNPATVGKTSHIKVDGYVDVTKYSWSYSKDGVTFSPAVTLYNDNETWATFGTLSAGTGILKVTMEHPCGTRELTQSITVSYPTGVEDVTATVVTVYPNPTDGILKVNGTKANNIIRVSDVTGSLKGNYPTQEGITTIDLTGYAKGTYLVQYNGKAYKVIRK